MADFDDFEILDDDDLGVDLVPHYETEGPDPDFPYPHHIPANWPSPAEYPVGHTFSSPPLGNSQLPPIVGQLPAVPDSTVPASPAVADSGIDENVIVGLAIIVGAILLLRK